MAEYIKKSDVLAYPIWHQSYDKANGNAHFISGVESVIEYVEGLPTADVTEVRHARWEECDLVEPCAHGFGTVRHPNAGLKCTNCVHVFDKKLLWENNYCPNCGALMLEDDHGKK